MWELCAPATDAVKRSQTALSRGSKATDRVNQRDWRDESLQDRGAASRRRRRRFTEARNFLRGAYLDWPNQFPSASQQRRIWQHKRARNRCSTFGALAARHRALTHADPAVAIHVMAAIRRHCILLSRGPLRFVMMPANGTKPPCATIHPARCKCRGRERCVKQRYGKQANTRGCLSRQFFLSHTHGH